MPNSFDYLPWSSCPHCGRPLNRRRVPAPGCPACDPLVAPEPPPPVAPLTAGEWWQIVWVAAVLIVALTLCVLFTHRGP